MLTVITPSDASLTEVTNVIADNAIAAVYSHQYCLR